MSNEDKANDTSFKPGESGNPSGRPPKGYSITETIREMMNSDPRIKQALGAKVIDKALGGDLKAIELVWAYMDGKPLQKATVTFDDTKSTEEIAGILQKAYDEEEPDNKDAGSEPVPNETG